MQSLDGSQLEQALRVLKWSKAELSRRLGINHNTVGKWVSQNRVPNWASAYVYLAVVLQDMVKEITEEIMPRPLGRPRRQHQKPKVLVEAQAWVPPESDYKDPIEVPPEQLDTSNSVVQ